MKCFFVGTDDVWTTPPFLPNMESVMQIYKYLLHNRSIQTAQRKFQFQHVYSKQSSLIPPPFGRKNRRGNLFSCWPNIALNILLISWHFFCLELIVYAKSRALCCMRAVTWTRKKTLHHAEIMWKFQGNLYTKQHIKYGQNLQAQVHCE